MKSQTIESDKGSVFMKRSLYGRKRGRALSVDRMAALENVLPKVQVPVEFLTQKHDATPRDILGSSFPSYWMEIGFGDGDHLLSLMRRDEGTGYLGAEPFVNGVSSLVKDLQEHEYNRIRIIKDDGMILARSLTPASLDGIYILNPDPWHKKRHAKRRIISAENLDVFAHILKPEGTLVLTSDVPDLADWMITQTMRHPHFTWTAQTCHDWETPPQDWISTRYERKGAKGARKMVYLIFRKI